MCVVMVVGVWLWLQGCSCDVRGGGCGVGMCYSVMEACVVIL